MTVTLDKVSKSFDGKQVFSDFSHTLSLQGITALMGPSGCGKTTLLRLLCGLERPDSGKISGIPETYTFLFQENRLLPWASALENIALVSDTQTAADILRKVGLEQELHTLPTALSGGMQRRVALARALAHQSSVLLLDEPFKGLDAELCRKMIALLMQEAEKRPILFVTHSLQEAELAGATVINLNSIQKNM
ncbi:MAG: ATP-binding cassette domain-containing protein [Candidatus Fimenecus sp.]